MKAANQSHVKKTSHILVKWPVRGWFVTDKVSSWANRQLILVCDRSSWQLMLQKVSILIIRFLGETSRKWLTVAIFRKWQDSSVALWIEIVVILNWRLRLEIIVWYGFVGIVWYLGGGGEMASEFIHEEISVMDYNGLSWTIIEGGGSWLACMTWMDDWHGWLEWMTGMDDWHGWLAYMDEWQGWMAWILTNFTYWWLTFKRTYIGTC